MSKAGSFFFSFFATEEEDGEFFRFGFGFVLSPKSEPRLSLNVSKRCFPGCQLDGYLMLYFSSGHDCRGAKFGLRDVGSEVNVLGPVAFVVAHVFGLDKLTTTAASEEVVVVSFVFVFSEAVCCDDDVFCSSGHTIFPMVGWLLF